MSTTVKVVLYLADGRPAELRRTIGFQPALVLEPTGDRDVFASQLGEAAPVYDLSGDEIHTSYK